MTEQDYCQYIISKCTEKRCYSATNGAFLTTNAFLESYKNSQTFSESPKTRNKRIIEDIADVIDEQIIESADLGVDAKKILFRCQKKLQEIKTYDELFTVVSDFLWVAASRKASKDRKIMLIDNGLIECSLVAAWITEWGKEIMNTQKELEYMNEADNLSFSKRIFSGVIRNPNVAHYASDKNLKHRIKDYQKDIKKRQQLYYTFIATVIYREDLERRYH